MFGLFKKTVPPTEFGHGVLTLAQDWLANDAGRALGMRFDNFDGSQGWAPYLERKGIPVEVQKLHFRLFTHCALQAAFTQFDPHTQRAMTKGAMDGFTKGVLDYDSSETWTSLEIAYRGRLPFDKAVQALDHPDANIQYLPNPKVGVINAKYLIQRFVVPHLDNADAFTDDFTGYSSVCCAAIGCVTRATNQLSRSFNVQQAA